MNERKGSAKQVGPVEVIYLISNRIYTQVVSTVNFLELQRQSFLFYILKYSIIFCYCAFYLCYPVKRSERRMARDLLTT